MENWTSYIKDLNDDQYWSGTSGFESEEKVPQTD
jgi:hypothetical protein